MIGWMESAKHGNPVEWLGNRERAKQLLVMPIGIDKSHSRKWEKHQLSL
jgi:hypothetical protein